ncbi:MAG: hypothetical protein KY455_10205 [Euryarchaeota archaeon]|nr:hypothetical protein [Euryarchaeota archaeon]
MSPDAEDDVPPETPAGVPPQARFYPAAEVAKFVDKAIHEALEHAAYQRMAGATDTVIDVYEAGEGFGIVVYGKGAKSLRYQIQKVLDRRLKRKTVVRQ